MLCQQCSTQLRIVTRPTHCLPMVVSQTCGPAAPEVLRPCSTIRGASLSPFLTLQQLMPDITHKDTLHAATRWYASTR